MSSPAETVDMVFRWLRQTLGLFLPTLPFSGVYRRLTALFELTIKGSLPKPTDPLPWIIPLADDWIGPLPGISVSIDQIRLQVAQRPVVSPSHDPPQATPRGGPPVRP